MSIENSNNILDEVRGTLRRLHYSIHTEKAYCDWIIRYIKFHYLQEREALLIG